MARAGIYKSEVLRARDRLLAQGRHPSIDAVRVELGNTGSKTTIQRYLKEIEEEEGAPPGSKVAVSEALQDLVGRLASRLQEEADGRIAALAEQHNEAIAQREADAEALRAQIQALQETLEKAQADLVTEQTAHRATAEQLREQTLRQAQAAQQVADLQERLEAEAQHRASLEEKHQQARLALEHFREAAKEQRENEQRQHEQQVHYLQGELRTLNETLNEKRQEALHGHEQNARLTTELSQAQKRLRDAEAELSTLNTLRERLATAEQQGKTSAGKMTELKQSLEAVTAENIALKARGREDAERIQRLEVDLATARASEAAQAELTKRIQGWFDPPQGNVKTPQGT